MTRCKFEMGLDYDNDRIEFIRSIKTKEEITFPYVLVNGYRLDVKVTRWWGVNLETDTRVAQIEMSIIDEDGCLVHTKRYGQRGWLSGAEILTRLYSSTLTQTFAGGPITAENIRDKIDLMRASDLVPIYGNRVKSIKQMKKQMARIHADSLKLHDLANSYPDEFTKAMEEYDNPVTRKLLESIFVGDCTSE